MKVLVQKVSQAQVLVDEEVVASIKKGLLLFVCFEINDTQETLEKAVNKILQLRIFEDDQHKMNLSISQVKASILSVSQFTLSWDGVKGHRPSFSKSMSPELAKIKFKLFNDLLRKEIQVETGIFGADMKVNSTNDGPVTFHLDF